MPGISTAFGDPTQSEDVDAYEVTTNGGSTTLVYDEPFVETPALFVSGESGGAAWSAVGPQEATITGTDGDTVYVLVVGKR
jgi:hypothetical protein